MVAVCSRLSLLRRNSPAFVSCVASGDVPSVGLHAEVITDVINVPGALRRSPSPFPHQPRRLMQRLNRRHGITVSTPVMTTVKVISISKKHVPTMTVM